MATARLLAISKAPRQYFGVLVFCLVAMIVAMLVFVGFILYEVYHRPLPHFFAMDPAGQTLGLTPYDTPNLTSETLTTWANKAVIAAYTFDFGNYDQELSLARPYFTPGGWQAYGDAIGSVADRVRSQKLFVSAVVPSLPVVVNQGNFPNLGYTWRVQMPLVVTYQGAERSETANYTVTVLIVRVPTTVNPQGIGIEQFSIY